MSMVSRPAVGSASYSIAKLVEGFLSSERYYLRPSTYKTYRSH